MCLKLQRCINKLIVEISRPLVSSNMLEGHQCKSKSIMKNVMKKSRGIDKNYMEDFSLDFMAKKRNIQPKVRKQEMKLSINHY